MTIDDGQRAALRKRAQTLERLDRDAYEALGKDALEPVIGLGPAHSRIAFFGRDPGREEVKHGLPFVGAGGQKVRATLYRYLYGEEMPNFAASIEIGRQFFWANTVPYKPAGNKAWSMRVKRAFQPLMAEVLLHNWRGSDVITLGREAFLWFGIGQSAAVGRRLEAFWRREDRFESHLATALTLPDGSGRDLRLHPLPHPSPLNATWYKRFPGLLAARLGRLDVKPQKLASA